MPSTGSETFQKLVRTDFLFTDLHLNLKTYLYLQKFCSPGSKLSTLSSLTQKEGRSVFSEVPGLVKQYLSRNSSTTSQKDTEVFLYSQVLEKEPVRGMTC